ncbi:general stress protein [Aeromicrobium sp. UC242_57]|uniref:general stress protein n=1 Tax=Aeromicrobium sp. UC242_57 TaxID=3374624 RepID=UPI00379C80C2
MAEIFSLEYPQSLGVYDQYSDAQKAVDYLSDHEFPVQNVLIVGTELKQVERVTGRLTWGRVLSAGAASGAWLGLFIGLILSIFAEGESVLVTVLGGLAFGIVFGVISGALGYGATRGQRDFSSVQKVVATKYEVLVEHKFLADGQALLAKQPGAASNPFA